MAFGLALAVSLGAVTTLGEAAYFSWPRLRDLSDLLVVATACLGPFIGASVLWAAWLRQRRRSGLTARKPGETARGLSARI